MYRKTFIYSLKYFFLTPLNTVLFLVALPVVLAPILLAQTPSVPVCLYDLDNSESSSNVVNIISENENIQLTDMDISSAKRALETGSIEAIFELRPGFGEKISKGEYENLIYMQLSKYSRSGRTISDAVAAAVMQEYSKHIAYNTVLYETGDKSLAEQTVINAEKSDSVLIVLRETGKTAAVKDNGSRNSILYLSAVICAFALCFGSGHNSAVSQKLASMGKNSGFIAFIRNFGFILPIMLLFLIPIIIGKENIAYLGVLVLLNTIAVCALSALISNIPLTLRLNIAVFYSLINAIFTLSNLFESPVAYLFPGHILNTGIKSPGILPVIWMFALLSAFCLPAFIYKPSDKK